MDIKLHSNQKHIALGYYLDIVRNVITSPKTPFDKLYYADLYCGDGACHIQKTGEDYEPPIIKSILKPALQGRFPVCCFLNDLNNIEVMKKNTEPYKEFIQGYYGEDANDCYKQVLPEIPSDQFSIFVLDPFNHKHLKWSTIEAISQHIHVYTYNGKKIIRRPELIINCMTYTMLGSYMAKDYTSINQALGTDKWYDKIKSYKEKDVPVAKAFLDTFIEQLESLGYKVPTPIVVYQTASTNVIYYLIWAMNDNGYNIIENKVMPYLRKVLQKTLKQNKRTLLRIKAHEKGNEDLSKWF